MSNCHIRTRTGVEGDITVVDDIVISASVPQLGGCIGSHIGRIERIAQERGWEMTEANDGDKLEGPVQSQPDDAGVQGGDVAVGLEARPEGQEPQAGSSDSPEPGKA